MASNITGIIRHNNFLFCKSIPKLNLDLKQFLTKRLRNVSKADQPDQSGKSDRTQTDSNRARPKQPASYHKK
ncbi:hypothetical protein FIU74_12780 [Lactobacillus buchneri]|nr:hypothetical protein [Lentilactobacillus buchneri]